MPSIREDIIRAFRKGELRPESLLVDTKSLGRYLAGRLSEALGSSEMLTIRQFRSKMKRKSTERALLIIHRALQNRRGNQCVSKRTIGNEERTFHTGDINTRGYEAVVALLDLGRDGRERYGQLPHRLPRRSEASKRCGCASVCAGACVRTLDGLCVPRRNDATGFVGMRPHPSQSVIARNDVERRRVRRSAQTRRTRASANDRSSREDERLGHARQMRYSQRGDRLWRRPSCKSVFLVG